MPVAVSVPMREIIVKKYQEGLSIKEVAEQLSMSSETVRQIWRRYRDRGEAGLQPDYQLCGSSGPRAEKLIYRAAIYLKRRHPKWGAKFIKIRLQQKWPTMQIPHERTLQRYFKQAQVNRKKRRLPQQDSKRAKQVHEIWQMDATSHIKIADGSEVSWLTITDEKSGAIIAAEVFPPKGLGRSKN